MTRSKGTRSKSKLGQTGQDSPPASGRKRASDAGQDKASEVANLEKRRLAIAEELRHVEQQARLPCCRWGEEEAEGGV